MCACVWINGKRRTKRGTGQRDYSLSSEELHAQQSKDHDEEEEEEEQADDGLHGVEQRDDQVTQRCPIPDKNRQSVCLIEHNIMKV